MASGPITSWQVDGDNVGTVSDFTFLGFKINVNSDCSPKIKRCLLLGKIAVSNLDSVLKGRELKNWCFWTVVLEKTLKNPLDSKEIKLVNLKRNQSWILIGRTDAEAETPILWPPDAKNWLIWKDPEAGKDWRWEEKGTTEDELVVWHHWLHGYEFE